VEPWRSAADSDIQFTTTDARPAPPRRAPPYSLPWRQALLFVLASGCAARGLWLAAGFGKLRRWRRDAPVFWPLPPRLDALRAAVAPRAEFRLSSSISGPVTFGLWRPLVVLPGGFVELPADIREAIVCHELLHVRRRDWIVTVAEQAVRAALWFHPAIWWLVGQAQLAREQTVDSEVVALTGNPDGTQMTPKDEQKALIGERDKYLGVVDATFQLRQAEIQLLRQTGQLETWLKSALSTHPPTAPTPQP